MTVPVGPEICEGVRQFFEMNGEVEAPRPSRCPCRKEECGSTEPMRKNGSYSRQVIYWGLVVEPVLCYRFARLCQERRIYQHPISVGRGVLRRNEPSTFTWLLPASQSKRCLISKS